MQSKVSCQLNFHVAYINNGIVLIKYNFLRFMLILTAIYIA